MIAITLNCIDEVIEATTVSRQDFKLIDEVINAITTEKL